MTTRMYRLPNVGERFGLWVVSDQPVQVGRVWHLPCHCDCGTDRLVRVHSLIDGRSTSCGCAKPSIMRQKLGMTFEQRRQQVLANIQKQESGCWFYGGTKNSKGYGFFRLYGKLVFAHRFMWELRNGPIPDGLCACHKCDTPQCVNPDHIFIGTHKENMQDSVAKGRNRHGDTRKALQAVWARNRAKTHCKHGHAFTPENTKNYRGQRVCRACKKYAFRMQRKRERDQAGAA